MDGIDAVTRYVTGTWDESCSAQCTATAKSRGAVSRAFVLPGCVSFARLRGISGGRSTVAVTRGNPCREGEWMGMCSTARHRWT